MAGLYETAVTVRCGPFADGSRDHIVDELRKTLPPDRCLISPDRTDRLHFTINMQTQAEDSASARRHADQAVHDALKRSGLGLVTEIEHVAVSAGR